MHVLWQAGLRPEMNDIFLNDYSLAGTPTRANLLWGIGFFFLVFVPGLLGATCMCYNKQEE